MKKMFFATTAVCLFVSPVQAFTDISAEEAYDMLREGTAIMIDVRTPEEWAWVGHPGKNKAGEGEEIEPYVVNIAWEIEKPGNAYKLIKNNLFLPHVAKLNLPYDTPIITICRSGGRSVAAATALEEAGYTNIYNTLKGFEGGSDPNGYRTNPEGWKNTGLPYAFSYTGNIDYLVPGN